ncbi:hypothetical protein GA0070611_1000 [Micromonospora auratinigra]|uniref:Uncharacterized protein n=1 Tax=Micromonospora auratinigra TaxID=261654 RepID=A0A1A8Z772_9ACTN|nr:hypothetical protein GA0070611_1000 [Micromonospora auratinigra]
MQVAVCGPADATPTEPAHARRVGELPADHDSCPPNGRRAPAAGRRGAARRAASVQSVAARCAAARRFGARAYQASVISSVSSGTPIRSRRTSTDGWPSKCGVVK